jgi:cytochrome c peroxidase
MLACATSLACSSDSASSVTTPVAPVTPAAPALLSTNGVIATTVGAVLTYDATKGGTLCSDPAGSGLTYSITFSGAANGLSAIHGVITGTPAAPGVTTAMLTATDILGRTVSDPIAIVAFANNLPTPVLPAVPMQYTDAEVPLPAHFTLAVGGATVAATDNTPSTNRIADAGATLGRVLFYDPRLSASDGTACASCHVQSLGFSDGLAQSVGFAGGLTARHSPGLTNARFYARGHFFWDERAPTLEAQVLAPIQNATEMGMTLDALVAKLSATSYYAPLFASAFGTPTITSDRLALALAQYVRSLVSTGSRYDRAYSASGVANFASTLTAEEQAGEQVFRTAGCASCHTTATQVSDSVRNIGLDVVSSDTGAGGGAFKAPSLRNVAVRPRYMHDGRFTTLVQVVDFFDSGVQANAGLDARLKATNGTPKRLGLTAAQKASLVAFMKSLTDSTFLTATRFSDPFATIATTTPVAPAAAVTMQNIAYHPPSLTVTPGTTVTFTNLDNTRHSALFASPLIASTAIFSSGSRTVVMPATPGTYSYHCAVHGTAMSGTIVVK